MTGARVQPQSFQWLLTAIRISAPQIPLSIYAQIPVPNRMPKKGEYKGQKKSGTKKVQA